VVVQHGLEERRTPGNTLAVQPDKPYQGLSQFGTGGALLLLLLLRYPSMLLITPIKADAHVLSSILFSNNSVWHM
jgi:hypothetical protein